MESILAPTAGVAKLFMQENELGKIKPGYFVDCILVDGNPLEDISVLQNHDKLNVILINGRIHKASQKEFVRDIVEPASIGSCKGFGLTQIGDKLLNIEEIGSGSEAGCVFVHGLGGNTEFYQPLIAAAGLRESHKSHLFDLEGHGRSPTKSSSRITINSYADDLAGIFSHYNIKSGVLIAHSMGCLVAMAFALKHPSLVKKLVLIGP